jgi:hypothetical protein
MDKLAVYFQPIAGARFDEFLIKVLHINPQLPMTGLEELDRKYLLPLSAPRSHTTWNELASSSSGSSGLGPDIQILNLLAPNQPLRPEDFGQRCDDDLNQIAATQLFRKFHCTCRIQDHGSVFIQEQTAFLQ